MTSLPAINESHRQVLVLGNGRCYHTMDWFRSGQALQPGNPPVLVTELIEGESFPRLLQPGDRLERLLVIDGLLFRKQSRAGDIWRNLVKLFLLPAQVLRFRRILRRYPGAVVHAHSMYYIALARFAGCYYVATPQGSEVLARPQRSRAYRMFARTALANAARITVDSVAMQQGLAAMFAAPSLLVQNGINVRAIQELRHAGRPRDRAVSVRGFVPNYRIDQIIAARNAQLPTLAIDFCYPFSDRAYKARLNSLMIPGDRDLGSLERRELYELLLSAFVVVSIPESDSSPRSVYEAIFCGCIVVTSASGWLAQVPECMRRRVIVTDIASADWLAVAVEKARDMARVPFVPSDAALRQFDQQESMRRFYAEIYPRMASA
ncbi:MAG: glycosyltransferase [Gammaproteobacteria bacterium]|nr:glycosyltransferase [Gammaproteobacteria bacterium]